MENTSQNMQPKKKIGKRVIIVAICILIFVVTLYISYRSSYIETLEIGEKYLEAFHKRISYQYSIAFINFLILFVSIYITNKFIKNGLNKFFQEEKKEMPKLPNKSIAFILAIIIVILTSGILYEKTVLAVNSTLFGINDPIFNTDVGFYIFQKPFIELCIIYFLVLIIGLAIYTIIYYIAVFNICFDGINAQTLKKNTFVKQLTGYIMLVAIGIAAFIVIEIQGVIIADFLTIKDSLQTKINGAGLTDLTIKLWGYRILALLIIISAFLVIHNLKKKNNKKVIISISIVPTYLIGIFFAMIFFDIIFVNSNELDKEKEYIEYNIKNTRQAYNIDIETQNIENVEAITKQEYETYKNVIENTSIVPEDIVLKTLNISQTNTGYYSYRNTNTNVYSINGKDTLVHITPKEVVSSGNRTYDNKTYEYTHGYGAIITYANKTNEIGDINYIQSSFEGKENAIEIKQPRIYFGLETNNTIITNCKSKKEFDYPTDTLYNTTYTYNGNAGLKLGFWDRLLLGIKKGDIQLAFSGEITQESKVLMNRNIIERAKNIIPSLMYDEEPYLIISDEGKLVWVLDAYTTSNQYPYSQKTTIEYAGEKKEINYIRNSVKVLVDAYDGTTEFYITDKTDPIAIAYTKIYPNVFKEEEIPKEISKYIIYPKFLYKIQAEMLTMYHNSSPDVLYRGDAIWDIATHASGIASSTKGVEIEPYYTMVKTKNSEKEELGLVIPFTPFEKQNMVSYLVGTANKDNKLILYKFSSNDYVLGTMQLDKQIEQDETISNEIKSINVTGSKLVKEIRVIPINDKLLYIEPIYQLSLNESKSLPVLKKVVVASGTKVTIGDNLEEALTKLFLQGNSVDIEVENTDTIEDLVDAIIKANENLETSNNTNDWEMIGKDMKKLQELIQKLEELRKRQLQNEINNNIITNAIGDNIIKNNTITIE